MLLTLLGLGVVGSGLIGLAAGASPAAAAAPDRAGAVPGPVVVVGVPGLRWDDVDPATTPALHGLLGQGAVGTLVTRSVRSVDCPVDGWLALSAGRRAADAVRTEDEPLCRTPQPPDTTAGGPATLGRWPVYAQEAAQGDYGAQPGALGGALQRAGVAAVAIGPGAAVALADGDGALVGPYAPAGGPAQLLAQGVADAVAAGAQLVVVDAGALRDPDDTPYDLPPEDASEEQRGEQSGERDGEQEAGGDGAGDAPQAQQEDGDGGAAAQGADGAADDAADDASEEAPEERAQESPADDPARFRPERSVQAAQLDERVGAVLAGAPEGSTVLVAALAGSGGSPHLGLLAATGPGPGGRAYAEALVGSSSTRQDGIVQTTDLLPTVLELLGLPRADGAVGAVITPLPGSPESARERLEVVLDADAANQAVRPLIAPFFWALVALQLVLYGAAARALRTRATDPVRRRRVLRQLRWASVLFAAVPVATFLANLVPWWRLEHPALGVVPAVAGGAAGVAVLALAGPWGRASLGPVGAVAGATAGVLALDVLTGSRLMTSSLMGIQPVVGGRFYGFGNVQMALFATGALLLATAVADALVRRGRRRAAVAAVVLTGAVATVVDGYPGLGSDFGGPPAIVPAFALLALAVAGRRVTWRRLLVVAAGTAAVIVVLSVADWLRDPADRTHLGRFVQTVLDGGAWQVVQRKLMANLGLLGLNALTLLVPFAAAFVGLVLLRPAAWGAPVLQRAYAASPTLRAGLTSLLVLVAVGFAVNDSGVAVPAVAATLALPLVLAACARVLEEEAGAEQPPRSPEGDGGDDGRALTRAPAPSGSRPAGA
ncbi:hypothetical protein SAMN05428996_1148 [Quadrisphaera sp. DSM 44207]|nr:hypothetical protein SAMN05428996_1148 [Quadrisphaera sp. DSM 44207]